MPVQFLLPVLLAFLMTVLCGPAARAANPSPWRITKDHWTDTDERGYEIFIAALGASNCSSSESCLRSSANPWAASDRGRFVDIDVDCAKLAYLLRAYYAWKNGLPFSYVNAIRGEGDARYDKDGNQPVSRHDIIDHGGGIDGPAALRAMLKVVFTGTFRSDAQREGLVQSDFYSPALTPGSIHVGTMIYDTNGHVGIVWKVDGDGRIFYMDAHPDFTVTRSVYGAQFGQSPIRLGGGLKNWRPSTLVGARQGAPGLVGGHMEFARNEQIEDFSLVQYFGTEPNPSHDLKAARWFYDGNGLGFYEYVRVAVSGGKADYNPVFELKSKMKTLCNDLHDRAQYVDMAIDQAIAIRPHPAKLPANIYDSDDGTWESYATPSRDARLKAGFAALYHDLGVMIALWRARDPRIVYDGNFLRDDLLKAYDEQSKACTVTYLSSDKKPVALTFDDMVHRLFVMSFDPYMCIEARWGDDSPACPDGPAKRRWNAAERRLRNSPDTPYDRTVAFSLIDLEKYAPGSGIDASPAVDVRALIAEMPAWRVFVQSTPGQAATSN
ncbi:MAG TPA: hypothetical protein VHV26_15240 [Rhizomicrobium sp.]|nr:hypothetical protein [Rhizomicrobium sp.]